MRSSSLLIPTLLSAAAGYGICKVTQFRGQARYVAMFTGLLGLVSNRISISAKCLSKVEAMPNSNLRERMRDSYKRSKRYRSSIILKCFHYTITRTCSRVACQDRLNFCPQPTLPRFPTARCAIPDSSLRRAVHGNCIR